jgi:serine/threonine protein kinase/WD40 repeat protein
MTEPQPRRNPAEELAEAFLERYRRGERPSLSEYTRAHPELADEIRDLFPALVMMEEAGPREADRAAACGGRVTADGQELRRLGDYRILRQVGRGGMGIVYEAEQEALGRHVALKVLPFESAADPIRLERFRREARAAARLHHTNIVPVFDVDVQEGVHYYAMQFIQGQGLDEVLAEVNRLRASKAATVKTDLALAGNLASGLLTGQFQGEPLPEVREYSEPLERSVDATGTIPRANGSGWHGLSFRRAWGRGAHRSKTQGVPPASSASDVLQGRSDFSTQSDFHYYRSVARVGLQVADALAYAHGQRVLHRDIKPSNLLLDLQGIVWVTDFGLAKDEGEDLTRTGDVVGTLRYMAPERFNGISDQRSDIYSLGLTLYELATLRPAFEESDRNWLIKRIMKEEPPSPRRRDRRLPRDLETIILKAIAKEPGRRYQTAEALAKDLRLFLADRPIEARRVSYREQAWRWCRRNPALALLLGTVAVLLAALAIGSSLAAVWLKRGRDDATEKLFESLYNQARAGRFSRQMGQRTQSLDAVARAARIRRDDHLRDEAIAALALPDLRRGDSWEGSPTGTTDLTFDPSYQIYASANDEGEIRIYRFADHKEVRRIKGRAVQGSLKFSPDSQYLAGYHASTVTIWRLRDARPSSHQVGDYCRFAFSPDCRDIALAKADWVLRVDLATGEELNRFHLPAPAHTLAYHTDGKQLAVGYSSGSTAVSIFEAATGGLVAELPVGPLTYQVVAWHPDGERLAIASTHPRTEIWNLVRKRRVATLEGHGQEVYYVGFHPHGGLVATASNDGTFRLWDPSTGRQLLELLAGVGYPNFSSDGRYVGCTWRGTQTQVLEVLASPEYRTLVTSLGAGQGGYCYADVSLDGLLAVGMTDGIRLWDLSTGREVAALPGHRPSSKISPFFQDTEQGRELVVGGSAGWLRWPLTPISAFKPSLPSSELATNPRSGTHGGLGARELRIGPPQPLPLLNLPGISSRSSDGRFLATSYDGAGPIHVLDRANNTVTAMRGTHPGATSVALSPDGRWVATGGWRASSVRVWNANTGEMVREWPAPLAMLFFTPDSRTLIVAGGSDYRFFAVDGWNEARPRLSRDISSHPGYVAFTPDGRLMALEMGAGEIFLMEIATGRTIARLQDPHGDRATWLGFTADGSQLVVVATFARAIHVWDLRLIRQELREMGLDWDLPPYPDAPKDTAGPWRVTVDPGRVGTLSAAQYLNQALAETTVAAAFFPWDAETHFRRGLVQALRERWTEARDDCNRALFLQRRHVAALYLRGLAHQHLGQQREAVADFHQAIQSEPERAPPLTELQKALDLPAHTAVASNNLAWEYATGPSQQRYLELARLLAEKAVLLEPHEWTYLNTLGVVYYRLNLWQRALQALQRGGQALRTGPNAFDLYFLAMSYQRLGQVVKAKECYEKANAWWQARPNLDSGHAASLAAFRAEAAAVLGLPAPAQP